jgi:hypothetical protein
MIKIISIVYIIYAKQNIIWVNNNNLVRFNFEEYLDILIILQIKSSKFKDLYTFNYIKNCIIQNYGTFKNKWNFINI